MDSANASVLAIPTYWLMSILAHSYAIKLVTDKLGRWENTNPRSPTNKNRLLEKLGPELYGRYERCEAASANGLENLPLFASAVILGNMAGLPKEGLGGLNGFAGSYLVVRALYFVAYVNASRNKTSYVRSVLYFVSVGLCCRTFYKAAKNM